MFNAIIDLYEVLIYYLISFSMPNYNYSENLSLKTKFFNSFRRIFKLRIFEYLLQKCTSGKSPSSLFAKFAPMEYLYDSPTIRQVNRHGVKFELDISQVVDHFIYFNFKDKAFFNLMDFVKGDFVIVDIGANIGRFSFPFAKRAPYGQVICWEPDNENFKSLNKNYALNNFNNVTLINKGLGSENAILKLSKINKSNSGMNRILNQMDLEQSISSQQIDVMRLDNYLDDQKIERVDLIKIDVEGFEAEVIKGAMNCIKCYKPILFIEINDLNLKENNFSGNQMINLIESFGYKVFNGNTMEPVTTKDIEKQIDVICLPNKHTNQND